MRSKSRTTLWLKVSPVVVAAVLLTACSSSGGSGNTTGTTGSTTSGNGGSTSAAGTVDKAAAEAFLAPFTGKPGPFPVTEPLAGHFPAGKKIAYVDNGNSLVALMYTLMQPAAQALGIDLVRVKAGTAASEVQAAYNTVVQMKPAAVVNTAIDPTIWDVQRKALVAAKVPIVSLGTVAPASSGLVQPNSTAAFEEQGELQAAWVAANISGTPHPVLYVNPELAYTPAVQKGFTEELTKLCASCSARVVQIPIAEVGSTAPDHIVSDLQAHTDTNVIVLETSSIDLGLPAKMQVAGLKTPIIGANPVPANLQYLKDGQEAAEIGSDLNVLAWTAIDTAARLILGQSLDPRIAAGNGLVHQVVRAQDLTFDITKGYTAYPDAAERFKKLWGVN